MHAGLARKRDDLGVPQRRAFPGAASDPAAKLAFTVNPTACEPVRAYIANQAEHHRARSNRDELIEMLRRAEVEFDERYLD